jgi:2-methylisocitrate lyase-like PEP mutase family enzyme
MELHRSGTFVMVNVADAGTARAVADAGAAAIATTSSGHAATGAGGMGIEDWSGERDTGLYDRVKAIARIEASVEAADGLDHPFVITGRTEVLLYGHDGGMGEAIARLQGFAAVGAHCLYAPGPRDLESIRTITDQAGGPVNILVPLSEAGRPHSLGLGELAELGVRRISLGGSLYRAQLTFAADRVRSLLADGTF